MRVLELASSKSDNEFVKNIANGLIHQKDINVVCNPNALHDFDFPYQIIHLHWPEALFSWKEPTDSQVTSLKEKVDHLKTKGVKIVWTIHNDKPHLKNGKIEAIYTYFLSVADALVHLEDFSLNQFSEIQTSALQLKISHPSYEVPKIDVNRYSSRKGKFKVLVFGTLREFQERRLVFNLYRSSSKYHDLEFVITGWKYAQLSSWFKNPVIRIRQEVMSWHAKTKSDFKIIEEGMVSPGQRDELFHDVDLCFIPRLNSLNSGLPYLCLSYGLPFLAPAIKNIACVAKTSGNYIYDPYDMKSVLSVLGSIINNREKRIEKVSTNQTFAQVHLEKKEIGQEYLALFERLLSTNK